MKKFIYADNAATTKLDEAAFEAMKPFLLDEFGNASQPYTFARKPKNTCRKHERRLPFALEPIRKKFSLLQVELKVTIGQSKEQLF